MAKCLAPPLIRCFRKSRSLVVLIDCSRGEMKRVSGLDRKASKHLALLAFLLGKMCWSILLSAL